MQKVYLPSSFTNCNENCGLPDFLTDYQIRHLSNPSGLPEILPKIDPCSVINNYMIISQMADMKYECDSLSFIFCLLSLDDCKYQSNQC